MYKIKEEMSLLFDLLWAQDGNNSLKQIIWRSHSDDKNPNNPGPSSKRTDTRRVLGDMYIPREDVNKWACELVEKVKSASEGVSRIILHCSANLTDIQTQDPNYNPCALRWKNMIEEITNRMWGMFNETGIFMVFCRHGFTLVITDMVQSSEQYVFGSLY
jgi:hypothetical protein